MKRLPKVVWRSFAQRCNKTRYADVVELKVGKSDVWKPDKTHKGLNTTTREQPDTFPAWRTSGEDAPVDGDQVKAPAEVAAGAASVEVAAGADQENGSSGSGC